MAKNTKSKTPRPPWLELEAAALKQIYDALKTVAPARRIPIVKAAAILTGVQF
jgi:hypothetical protein